MQRFLVTLATTIAVLATACSGATVEPLPVGPVPAVAPIPTGSVTFNASPPAEDVPLSFLLRSTQIEFARAVGRFLCDNDYWNDLNQCDVLNVADKGAYDWTTASQCLAMHLADGVRGCKSDGLQMSITFHDWSFDPAASDLVYGPVSHKNSQPKEYNGVGYLAELHDYDEEVPFKQTVTVTESKVRSVETTRTIVIDWGVESEQKVGGEFAGASFEASLKEHFSVSDSTEDQAS